MKQSTHSRRFAIHRPRSIRRAVPSRALVFSTTFERPPTDFPPAFHTGARTIRAPGARGLHRALEAGRASASRRQRRVTANFKPAEAGDHLRAPAECYHGTLTQIRTLFATHGIEFSLFEARSANLEHQLRPNTRLYGGDTEQSLLGVSDIAAIARWPMQGRTARIDSTFQRRSRSSARSRRRPRRPQHDEIFGGHSDVTGGAVIVPTRAPKESSIVSLGGAVPSRSIAG